MTDEEGERAPVVGGMSRRQCLHPRFSVSHSEAELCCAECKAPLDPWWCLRKLAREGDRFAAQIKVSAVEAHRLKQQVDALKVERANLQAQVKRLRAKAAP